MEMVSAAKMRKAVQAALSTRMYAKRAKELMDHLSYFDEPNYPLLEKRPVSNVLMILVSSNRGLCGSFNANMMKKAKNVVQDKKQLAIHDLLDEEITDSSNINIDVLGIGRKSAIFAKRHNLSLTAVYDDIGEKPSFDEVRPISKEVIDQFLSKKYDKVLVVYTHFVSALAQEAKVRQLLPLSKTDVDKMIKEIDSHTDSKEEVEDASFPIESYLFEPDTETIINTVVPQLVEVQLYQAILESSASEHSSRMIAMKNASEAAGDMIDNLNTVYNKARQAAITQEIAEIAGGAAALE